MAFYILPVLLPIRFFSFLFFIQVTTCIHQSRGIYPIVLIEMLTTIITYCISIRKDDKMGEKKSKA